MAAGKKTSLLFKGKTNFVPEYMEADFYKNRIQEDTKKKKEFLDDIAPDFPEAAGLVRKEKGEGL